MITLAESFADRKFPEIDLRIPGPRKTIIIQEHVRNRTRVYELRNFWSYESLPIRAQERLEELSSHFFTPNRLRRIVVPIITITSKISLRTIDWLVINYAKTFKVVITTPDQRLIPIYDEYRRWLKFWKRSLFDAFRRGSRIMFELDDHTYTTTVAQLNFLYWCYRNYILHYALENLVNIEHHMRSRLAACKQLKMTRMLAGQKRRRSELSQVCKTKCFVYNIPFTVRF